MYAIVRDGHDESRPHEWRPRRHATDRAYVAIKTAASKDESVTQEIAWVVKGGKADCVINGTSVVSLPVADLVQEHRR